MKSRIIKLRESKKGNKYCIAVVAPSLDAFVNAGAEARLVQLMHEDGMAVGSEIPNLDSYVPGQSQDLPPRTDGKPSSFTKITWLDKA